jgi:hypothetical protein
MRKECWRHEAPAELLTTSVVPSGQLVDLILLSGQDLGSQHPHFRHRPGVPIAP